MFVGAGLSFLLVYFVIFFLMLLLSDAVGMKEMSVAALFFIPIPPALFAGMVGGAVGILAAEFPRPIHAALFGSGLCAVVGTMGAVRFFAPQRGAFEITCVVAASAAAGAIIGGAVAIANRDRTESGEPQRWPRYYLNEMLVAFLLMSVIFACITALVRPPR